jgi:Zn-dependent oligopeptidase
MAPELKPKLNEVNIWEIFWQLKTREDYFALNRQVRSDYAQLEKLCNGDVDAIMRLRTYGESKMAWGILRGLQFGSQLGNKVENTIAAAITKHASVRRLLVKEPVVSTLKHASMATLLAMKPVVSTTLEVCQALDKVNEPLPWLKLSRKSRFWVDHAKTSTVKMAITLARKAALQSALDEEFIQLIKAIGDVGSLFERFQSTKRAVAKRRK